MKRFFIYSIFGFVAYVSLYFLIKLWLSNDPIFDILIESVLLGFFFSLFYFGLFWYSIKKRLRYIEQEKNDTPPGFSNILETNFKIPPQLDFETMVNEIEKKWKVEFINPDKCIIKFQKGITFRDWGFGAFLEVRSNTAYLVTFPLSGNSMGQNKRAKAFNHSIQNLISNC